MGMNCQVYANGNEIACKEGGNKVIAEFPDVCLSPPSPPAGPVPVPYPDTSMSSDMQSGSKTVKIKGGEIMLKDQSFYKTSPLGDEAATNGLGANVMSHTITGKTYFVAYSMDVKFEGANVDRHMDMTTSNHMCAPAPAGTGPTGASAGGASPGGIPPPPGDCTQAEHDKLNKEVQDSKAEVAAAGGRCEVGDSPNVLARKGKAWRRQAQARAARDGRCYRGGDAGHQEAQAQAWHHVGRCERIARGERP